MFTSNKPSQLIFSALSVLMLAQGSKASDSGAIYRPTDLCGLILAVYSINTTQEPSIIDLGSGVFEFYYDCVTQLDGMACPNFIGTSSQQVCYQNGTSPQFGLSALPEIYAPMSIVNGRILRAVQIAGIANRNYFRLISILGTPVRGNLSLFKNYTRKWLC